MIVALDSEAFNALAGPDSQRKRRLRRILRAAHQLGRDVLVPTLVLAELYRGHGHNQLVDACLARERASLESRDTFAGISPASVPMFLVCQAIGGGLGYLTARTLYPKDRP